MKTYTVKEAQRLDKEATAKYGIPSILLMENAGRSSFEIIQKKIISKTNYLIFIGSGNNGGDGLVLARHLANHKKEVALCFIGNTKNFSEDTRVNWEIVSNYANIHLIELEDLSKSSYDIIVDALFGTGLSRNIEGKYKEAIEFINNSGLPVVSLDIPSGLSGDTGDIYGLSVVAQETIAMGLVKKGLLEDKAKPYVGNISIANISLPQNDVI